MPAPAPTAVSNTEPEADFLLQAYTRLRQAVADRAASPSILPSAAALADCLAALPSPASPSYLAPLGPESTYTHLVATVLPALNSQALSPRYLGFVAGGVLPIAEAADNLVSALDQNVQVHFPFSPAPPPPGSSAGPSSSANPSSSPQQCPPPLGQHRRRGRRPAHARLPARPGRRPRRQGRQPLAGPHLHHGRHGEQHPRPGLRARRRAYPALPPAAAAAAACPAGRGRGRGRRRPPRRRRISSSSSSSSRDGTDGGQGRAAGGVREIRVLTSTAHSSVAKAASVVGLGRASVRELPLRAASVGGDGDGDGEGEGEEPWRLDLDAVERELETGLDEGVAFVIVVSAGEVNTGRFATSVLDMPKLRSLADRYGAWIHVDGAFGLFARALPKTDEFLGLHAHVAGLELADSIAADGHKLLNVPYDNGIFLCRDASTLTNVCRNANAAYLSSPADPAAILSPLNIGLENSRRFRALPVYAVLLSEGRQGIAAMLSRMVLLAREIAAFVRDSERYEWLPSEDASLESTYIVVLFLAKDAALNEVLVDRINGTGKMFVSGTSWKGTKAARIAVGSWRVDVARDAAVIKEVLTDVAEGRV